jgi:MoxR-like ATPase
MSEQRVLNDHDLAIVRKLGDSYRRLREEMAKVIVGQEAVIEELLTAVFCRGHCMLEGVPGLAKTLMISTLARSLNLQFSRIQFTPDLMPSDITGTEVIQEDRATGRREFKFLPGPLFANVVLADEINRTPPKTQAALLEAMQEHQVTTGVRRPLAEPFFVLATQNPIEQEGTYPLPEAQLDRFMFKIFVDYPSEKEEFEIVRATTAPFNPEVSPVLNAQEILELQDIVRRVPVADHVIQYAMRLTRLTRVNKGDTPKFVNDHVSWGAGPRATQFLILGGKARAILHGNYYVSTEDVAAVALPVLRHRVLTNFNAEAEGITSDKIVQDLLKHVSPKETENLADARLPKEVIPAAQPTDEA